MLSWPPPHTPPSSPDWLRHPSDCGMEQNLGPRHLSPEELFPLRNPSQQRSCINAASGVSQLLSHLGPRHLTGSGYWDVGGVFMATQLACGKHPK